jgi:hypothetical protein
MKRITLIGLVLVAFGIGIFPSKSNSYTTQEKILDIGFFETTLDTENNIPLSPILGGISLVGGVALILVGSKNK